MSYDEYKLDQTEHALISRHRQGEKMAPGTMFAVTEPNVERTALEFLTQSDVHGLRAFFSAATNHQALGTNHKLVLFHAVSAIDGDINNTNSRFPTLHLHVVGHEAPGIAHIYSKKTYVPTPNPNLGLSIAQAVGSSKGVINALLPEGHGESKIHKVIVGTEFGTMADFFANSANEALMLWRDALIDAIEPMVEQGAGGARIIFNDRSSLNNAVTHVIGGQDLGQVAGARWFQNPDTLTHG